MGGAWGAHEEIQNAYKTLHRKPEGKNTWEIKA
jgi:hypothetical protein